MDLTNRQVALLTIFIVLTGAVAFNMTGFTGSAVKDTSSRLDVQPVVLSHGEDLRITIHPGEAGTMNKVEFFTRGIKVGETPAFCKEQRCYGRASIIYEIPTSWEEGLYVAHVFDYSSGNYVQDYFTVE
ncbi:MAG: hypothetical protein AABX86_02060 [Nanoarchaeota archaeon]